MLSLLKDHPELVTILWAVVIWPIFSGLMLTLLDRWLPRTDEQWAALFATHPKTAALASVLKTLGVNIPGFFRSVRSFFAGPPPELKRPADVEPKS